MLGKRTLLYLTLSVSFSRYLCYLLVISATIICLADLLCSRRYLSQTHIQLRSKDGYVKQEDNEPRPKDGYTLTPPKNGYTGKQPDSIDAGPHLVGPYSWYDTQQHPHNGDTEQRPKHGCKGPTITNNEEGKSLQFSATKARLEKAAFELHNVLRKRFLDTNKDVTTSRRKGYNVGESSSPLKSVFRYNVVIMAYKRSGSSYVGQIFNQHPDVLYLYEPIYFLKALKRYQGNVYKTLSRHLLKTIFTCSFEENPYFVSQLSDSAFRLYSRTFSEQNSMCPKKIKNLDNVGNECKRLDVRTLIDMCQSHRHVVIKSIRIEDLNELADIGEPNIEAPWNIMKIVHLVRDPRAIISSRARLESEKKGWTVNDYRLNARALCTKMLKNLKSGTSRTYNGMYRVVRYEDIVTQQECAIRDLFKFTDLPMSDQVLSWLNENNREQHNDYAFSTSKNITISMNSWRLHNKIEVIRVVEQECSIIMALLGYSKIRDESQLQDIAHPLFLSNRGPSIFMTRNISDSMSEIMRLKDIGMLLVPPRPGRTWG